MGVQRIQETSTASYGKSVEAAAAGNSSAAGSGSATGGTTQTVENITTPWKAENKNSTDTKNSLSARNDKDEEQETLVGAGNNTQIRKAVEEINKRAHNSEAVFGIHDATNRVMIKIVDKDTKEVLKEYPPEKTLDMIAKVWEVAGLFSAGSARSGTITRSPAACLKNFSRIFSELAAAWCLKCSYSPAVPSALSETERKIAQGTPFTKQVWAIACPSISQTMAENCRAIHSFFALLQMN